MADFSIKFGIEKLDQVLSQLEKLKKESLEIREQLNKSGKTKLDDTGRSASSSAAGVNKLTRQIEGLTNAELELSQVKAKRKKVEKELASLAGTQGAQVDTLKDKFKQLAAAEAKARVEVSRYKAEISRVVREQNNFKKSLFDTNKDITDFTKRIDIALRRLIAYRVAFGIFSRVTRSFSDTISVATDLNDALGDLQKVLRGTATDIQALREASFDFGEEFGRSPLEVAEGFKIFSQQGLKVEGILERTRALMLAVSATTLTTRDAITALTVASKNFEGEFDNLTRVVDKFLASERLVPVAAKSFADALATVGQGASEIGLTLDELNGIVAAVGAVTQKTGRAIGTSFRTIFARAVSDDAIDAFKDLNIAVFASAGTLRPFGDVLRDLANKWGGLNQEQRLNISTVLGQRRRYTDFLALMNNFGDFTKVATASQLAFNDATVASAVELEKFNRRFESLNASFAGFKEALGIEIINAVLDLVQGLDGLLRNLRANAKEVANVVFVLSKFILIFGSARIAVSLFSSIIGGIRWLAIAKGAATVSASMGTLTAVLRGAVAVITPLTFAIVAIVTAFNLYSAATDKATGSTQDLEDFIKQTKREIEDLERSTLKTTTALNKFDRARSVSIREDNIKNLEAQLISTQVQIEAARKTAEKEIPKLQKNIDGIVARGTVGIFNRRALAKDKEEINRLNSEIQAGERRAALINAEMRRLSGEIAQISSNKVLPEDLRAVEIQKLSFATEDLNEQLSGLEDLKKNLSKGKTIKDALLLDKITVPEILVEGIEFDKGISLVDIPAAGTLDFLLELDNEDAQRVIDAFIERINTRLRQTGNNLQEILSAAIDDLNKTASKGVIPADPFSKAEERVVSLGFELDNLSNKLDTAAETSLFFGESFDKISETSKIIKGAIASIDKEIQSLNERRFTIEAQFAAVKPNEILQEEKDLRKEIEEINRLLLVLEEKRLSIQGQYGGVLKKNKDISLQLLTIQQRLTDRVSERLNNFDRTGSVLRGILNTESSLNSLRFSSAKTIKEELAIKKTLSAIEEERVRETFRQERSLLKNKGITEDSIEFITIRNKLENSLNKIYRDRRNLLVDVLTGLSQQQAAVQASLTSAIAGSLAQLPRTISERKTAEEELAVRRKELEFEVQLARQQGDAAALAQAQRGLLELELEARRLGSVLGNVFDDALGKIADIRLNKIAEDLTSQLLDIEFGAQSLGERISSSVLLDTTKAAAIASEEIKNAAIEGHTDGGLIAGNELNRSITAGGLNISFEIVKGHEAGAALVNLKITEAHTRGSSVMSSAIRSATAFGATIIGQAVGGGGARAGIGASLGGLLGTAIPGLGPVVGPLVGSLAGGLIGGLFDRPAAEFIEPLNSLTDAVSRNTVELANNNRLLELSRSFINAPTSFVAPPAQGSFAGGVINVNISAGSESSANDIASATVEALDNLIGDGINRSGSTAPTFGR